LTTSSEERKPTSPDTPWNGTHEANEGGGDQQTHGEGLWQLSSNKSVCHGGRQSRYRTIWKSVVKALCPEVGEEDSVNK